MQMHFWKEGQVLNYEELLETLKQIINYKVIDELSDEEIDKLYVKVWDTAYYSIKQYLEERNFRIINPRQGLLTAYQVKLVLDKALWDEALERKTLIEKGVPSCKQVYEKGIRSFIKEDYFLSLKEMKDKLAIPQLDDEE